MAATPREEAVDVVEHWLKRHGVAAQRAHPAALEIAAAISGKGIVFTRADAPFVTPPPHPDGSPSGYEVYRSAREAKHRESVRTRAGLTEPELQVLEATGAEDICGGLTWTTRHGRDVTPEVAALLGYDYVRTGPGPVLQLAARGRALLTELAAQTSPEGTE